MRRCPCCSGQDTSNACIRRTVPACEYCGPKTGNWPISISKNWNGVANSNIANWRVMLQYASRFKKHCYRSFILRYFGEWSKVRDCGNCSRCAPDRRVELAPEPSRESLKRESLMKVAAVAVSAVSTPAATEVQPIATEAPAVVALKVLSCVLRAKEQLGRGKIAKILAGSEDVSIQDFRNLTTYGILSTFPIRTITEIIDRMIEEGYIDAGQGLRPVIAVTPKGHQFLRDRPRYVGLRPIEIWLNPEGEGAGAAGEG